MMNSAEYAAALDTIKAASAAYYADGTSTLSDAQYDALRAQVAEYETAHGIADGVSVKVAAGGVASGDVEHTIPMLSLDNAYSADDLAAFVKRTGLTSFAVEPKLDGLAMCIRYEDGGPVQMVTRGDGLHGEDVTFSLPQIVNLPKSGTFTGEVRGEVIFTREQFEKANALRVANNDKPFVNARNGAAGALRGAKDRGYDIPMSFYAYDVVDGARNTSHVESMNSLSQIGFDTATTVFEAAGIDGIHTRIATEVADLVDLVARSEVRDQFFVETDGLVIKADRADDRDRLGAGSKAPRWAVAYKFPAAQVTTKLTGWDMEVGRTGVITPRAILDPVFVGGTTVTHATLHNFDDLARKDIRVGDTVVIVRAGEVIPRVEAVVFADRDGTEQPILAPTACPRCSGPLDTSQARLRCEQGRACGVTEAISYAVGRDALDIEGLGKTQVANLVRSGAFIDVASIFEIGVSANVLIADGKVAPANAPKIIAQIEKAKQAPLARVITGLGIKGTGRSMSRRLAAHFGSMPALQAATVTALAAVEGVGETKAELIRTELDSLANVIDRLVAAGVVNAGGTSNSTPAQSPAGAQPLAGMSVCVSGTMTTKTRNEMNELVESLGGRAASSVSKSTSILVAGPGAGSKLAKAKELGVRVCSEDEFLSEFAG